MKRVLLTDEDFAQIVRGEIITKNGVETCLQDIGWPRMMDHIMDAQSESVKSC